MCFVILELSTVSAPTTESTDTDVSAALEELTLRQKQRQYSASLTRNVLSGSGSRLSSTTNSTDNEHKMGSNDASDNDETDINSSDIDNCNDKACADHVSQPVSKSSSPEGATSVSFDAHRGMIEQSRALLEQSKVKHHALIAQAYSVQRSLRRNGHSLSAFDERRQHQQQQQQPPSSSVPFVPKPPSVPHHTDRRTTNNVRTQRLVR